MSLYNDRGFRAGWTVQASNAIDALGAVLLLAQVDYNRIVITEET